MESKAVYIKGKKKYKRIKVGRFFYNPEYHGIHQLRKVNEDDTVVLSGCCNYLSDANTTISNYVVPLDYLLELELIKEHKPHKCLEYDDIGVRVIVKGFVEKAYLFYKDKNILHRYNHDARIDSNIILSHNYVQKNYYHLYEDVKPKKVVDESSNDYSIFVVKLP